MLGEISRQRDYIQRFLLQVIFMGFHEVSNTQIDIHKIINWFLFIPS